MNQDAANKDVVIVTGGGGFIGRAITHRLAGRYAIVVLDRHEPENLPASAAFVPIDLASDEAVREAMRAVQERYGQCVASVIHLAAYFDLTGDPSPKYEHITVRGTERLLRELQGFEVGQFIFASTMLVHRATGPAERIDESQPLDPKLPYRASKIETERLIHEQRGSIPVVYLRPAGVYDDLCHNAFLAHQIARINEHDPKGHLYSGHPGAGQSFLHLDDFAEAVSLLIERRKELPPELPLLLGESDVTDYGELQRAIGRLLHDEEWKTWSLPKPLAKAGAWIETEVLGEDPFIRPWMVDIAGDNYELDTNRARDLLGWEPKHSLRSTLPKITAALKDDPVGWYEANKLNAGKVAGQVLPQPPQGTHRDSGHEDAMQRHMDSMVAMRQRMLWVHFLIIALGAWLITSPFQFAFFDGAAARTVRDISQERDLWDPALRNALMGWSDIVSGALLILFGTLSLSARFTWAQWGTTAVGLWLLFAPLLLWAPGAAAYANDTIVGTLAITFSVLVSMMPGMSHEGMMDESTVPAGWSYSPSSWLQRLPMIALGLFGFLIARYMAAYQFGHIDAVWEPFFSGEAGKNGTEHIITSDISRAWPIADSGLGATSYLIEALMGAMGAATRWRTMPWMVTFFFILVVPLGGVSIFFIIIQPILIGTYCTLCLVAAAAMLMMIPLTLDEVVAMGQYMLRSHRAGRPFLRTFFRGGPDVGIKQDKDPGFEAPLAAQAAAAIRGVTLPWTLLASCAVGAWLMFSRAIFGTEGLMADSDHLVGAMVITIAVCATAEVTRPLRFLNVLLGLWLIAAPWLIADGAGTAAAWNDMASGLLIAGLSLPRGRRSTERYGAWDRYVV